MYFQSKNSFKLFEKIRSFFYLRIFLIILNDFLIVNLSLFFSYFLRLEYFINPVDIKVVFLLANVAYFSYFFLFKKYLIFFRFFSFNSIIQIFIDVLILSILFLFFIIILFDILFFPRSLILIFPIILFFILFINRYLVSFLLNLSNENNFQKIVVIGFTPELSNLLIRYPKILFYADNKEINLKRNHEGVKILPKNKSIKEIKKTKIDKLLIFDNDLFNKMRDQIHTDIINNKILIEKVNLNSNNLIFEPYFDFNYFFGRKSKISMIPNLYDSKTILITGAGGSIGTGIVKQLLKYKFSKIILIDNSEYNIYNLENSLLNSPNYKLIEIYLSDFHDFTIMDPILKNNKIDVVIHTAAYKHVPIIEKNIFSALKNNFLNTYDFINRCSNFNVPYFCLISSDKAVRPTNIMGATKRLAELGALYLNNEFKRSMIINTVRFGNVINSSGSVLPLFLNQISKNGPVTITDERITRYFMTIEEAASLVLSTYSISRGGEIFLLDMGDEIKIYDLIKLLIQFSGKRVNQGNMGGVKIEKIGLRNGEKLYEELLVDNSSVPTKVINIYRSIEKNISSGKFKILIKDLKKSYDYKDSKLLKEILKNEFINYQNDSSSKN